MAEKDSKDTKLEAKVRSEPLLQVPTEVATRGPEAVTKFIQESKSKRANLIKALSKIKALKLNTAKRVLFECTSSFEKDGDVIISLSAHGQHYVVFGQNGVPEVEDLPFPVLTSLYDAVYIRKELLDVSDGVDKPVSGNYAYIPANFSGIDHSGKLDAYAIPDYNNLVTLLQKDDAEKLAVDYAERSSIQKIEALLSLEKENRNRYSILTKVEEILMRKLTQDKNKEVLQSLGSK